MKQLVHKTLVQFVLGIAVLLLVSATFVAAQEKQAPATQPVASTTATTNAAKPQLSFSQRYPRYQLGPGDKFAVRFEFSPEFDQTVTVQPDGFITLRGIGDLHVTGKTVPELTEILTERFGKFLNRPVIAVELQDFQPLSFFVIGQVARPGRYILRGDTTVVEGIALAGGFETSAKHSQVVLFRKVSQEWVEAKLLNVKKMLNHRNLAEDLHLQPGDMIFVPQNRISKLDRFIPRSAANIATQTNTF